MRAAVDAAVARAVQGSVVCAYVRKSCASLRLHKDAKEAEVRAALSAALSQYPHR